MNNFDLSIETYLSHIHFGHLATKSLEAFASLYTFKGLVLLPLLWWLWFEPNARREWRREVVIATAFSGVIALFLARLLTHWLPFRVRPVYSTILHLQFANSANRGVGLMDWSSLPSDHAMLWMAIATGIFLAAPRIGLLALLYAVFFICAPRAYLGLHYPTDLLAGAAMGIAITVTATRDAIRARIASPALRWIERHEAPAAMVAFVLCAELVMQFDELRDLASGLIKHI
ncbi:phosphatase PAP2 family protein [Paraburkholderia graminis]|uniref:Membrane-associated phospholipid phosphatase n=1 Tax=Paraburkholderia graminis TaxID=60548 RepID=A0ABD5CA45_9BURK|nr:phosphatase PAP2 family protein [Paraburkholderia graminis]MDR6201405.1 membrane-associated phospholipid phosphatase [Paraburkholderia graminis]